MHHFLRTALAVTLLTTTTMDAFAQDAANPCEGKNQLQIAQLALGEVDVVQPPGSTPDARNAGASSASGSAGTLVDSADRPRLIALAMDAGLLSENEGAATLTVSPFLWVAFANPDARRIQAEYAKYELARRFTGKVTWGGKGDAFDRDGDGIVDDALTTTSASDMVSYELAVRVYGSRDRREKQNYRKLEESLAFKDAILQRTKLAAALVSKVTVIVNGQLMDPNTSADICRIAMKQVRETAASDAAFAAFEQAEKAVADEIRQWAQDVDAQTLVSVVASGTERDEKFGGDKRSFGLRGSMGKADISEGGYNHNLELDYLRNELPNGRDELEGVKLGYEFNRLYRTFPAFGWKNATLSASVAVEKYSDAPAGVADSIAKAQAKVTFMVNKNLKVPFSVTWANRASLLDDNEDVIGHVGLSYDFDAFFARN